MIEINYVYDKRQIKDEYNAGYNSKKEYLYKYPNTHRRIIIHT